MRPGVLLAFALVLAVPIAAAAGQPAVAREAAGVTVRAIHLPGGLRVDGRLDEEICAAGEAIGDFVQQEPDEGRPATERTEAWIFFDDDHVYGAARCWDSRPDRRVANEMRRDTSVPPASRCRRALPERTAARTQSRHIAKPVMHTTTSGVDD